MPLTLEVVGTHAASMGPNARRMIGDSELTIGRDPANDWVLPHSYVSRRQAVVRCVNGMYFLEQIGNCPITLNDAPRPLERERIVRLSPGDRILIDDIEIRVADTDALPAEDAPDALAETHVPAEPYLSFNDLPLAEQSAVDPLELLGGRTPDPRHSAPAARRVPNLGSILDEALPPAPAPLGDDWFASTPIPNPPGPAISPGRRPAPPPMRATLAPAPPPSPAHTAPAPRAPDGMTLADMLRGAGLDPTQPVSPEIAVQLGQVLRIVVDGTMQVLQARNEIRKEFRLPTTQVSRRDNNPLKFSADADDALHKLLVQRSVAYLDAVSSFKDAFDDIRLHQLAMLESLRAAFDHMLRQFDPEVLQHQFSKPSGRSLLGAKPKLWEAYLEHYAAFVQDRDYAFRHLFGEEFGKAYERNLEEQKRVLKAGPNGR
jgi:type VI secretion system protein ImpI